VRDGKDDVIAGASLGRDDMIALRDSIDEHLCDHDASARTLAHTANAYPKLVEKSRALYDSLQGRLNTLIHHTATPHEKAAYRKAREEFRALLRELGEDA
jgi:hypothetical protein